MEKKRILALLVSRAAGEINDAELAELKELLARHPDALYYEQFIAELWESPRHQAADIEASFERHLALHDTEFVFSDTSETETAVPHERHSSGKGPRLRRLARAAVLLLAGVAAYIGGGYFLRSDGPAGGQITIIAEKGIKKEVTLPDGTHIWLNADSRLSYAADFGKGDTRAVKLEGEAYFDVAKDKSRPFTIATDKIAIRVLGTSFNVKAYPEDSEAEATLLSGEIELFVNDRPHEKIRMKPHEKVAVTDCAESPGKKVKLPTDERTLTLKISNLKPVSIDDREYIAETGWVESRLIFRNETLKKMIPQLERWYGVEITVDNPKMLENRYTSIITNEEIDQLLTAMQLAKPFRYEEKNGHITIY